MLPLFSFSVKNWLIFPNFGSVRKKEKWKQLLLNLSPSGIITKLKFGLKKVHKLL